MSLIRRLKENRDSGPYPFHMPGHKRMKTDDDILTGIFGIDITETEGFDDLHDAHGILAEAEGRAAQCFGADETHFLVNGSTCGILAAICASVTDGDDIIIGSNCHRSVYNAVMLSGAEPYVITPEREAYFDIFGGVASEDVKKALIAVQERSGRDASAKKRLAVVITSPTYEGITSDIEAIAKICHEKGAVLIVDAAHGSHFGFSDMFPKSAVGSADIVITGVHKTLPSMTQTALIHINKSCPVKERVQKMLPVFMTSSPSYVFMASMDHMTETLLERGKELFEAYERRLEGFYRKAEEFKCLSVLTKDRLTAAGSADHDPGRIVVSDLTGTYTGRELSDMLRSEYGICTEMAAGSYMVLITSIADTDEGFLLLTDALADVDEKLCSGRLTQKRRGFVRKIYDALIGRRIARNLAGASETATVRTGPDFASFKNNMKSALFEDKVEYIPVELSEGRTAADLVCIYPPGIPAAVPGRIISGGDADALLDAKKNGLNITGLVNGEIGVIWERSSI